MKRPLLILAVSLSMIFFPPADTTTAQSPSSSGPAPFIWDTHNHLVGRSDHGLLGLDQQQVVVDLYKLVLPDWDQIQNLKGHPEVGMELALFICRKFQEFDRQHHPSCMPAGAWMNYGFSVNRELDPWAISFENCTPMYFGKS